MAYREITVPQTRFQQFLKVQRNVFDFLRRWPVVSIVILAVLLVTGISAPWIAPYDPIMPTLADRNDKPIWYPDSSGKYILGADQVGRDVLSRLIHGARISLVVMSVSVTSGMIIGSIMGLVSGYFGGIVDEVIMRLVDVWLSIPFLLVALVVVVVMGQSFAILVALLALLAWAPFVRNARVSGASTIRILISHMFPNVLNTIMVIATLRVGQLIMVESILSFLGAGIPPPTPSWGVMVNDGRNYINDAWWISFFPGVAILLVVMAFNFIGDWTRDRVDPRLRQL